MLIWDYNLKNEKLDLPGYQLYFALLDLPFLYNHISKTLLSLLNSSTSVKADHEFLKEILFEIDFLLFC